MRDYAFLAKSFEDLKYRSSKFIGRLQREQSGLALVEFAMSLPIFMGLGMYGTEIANLAVSNMQASQIALNLADNASRLGVTVNNVAPTITESDILESFKGSELQGESLKLLQNGRVILSSLEVKTVTSGGVSREQQYISWQRCKGIRNKTSAYVSGINTSNASFTGVGPTGSVQANSGSAVMYVEIEYQYQPLFGTMFTNNRIINQEAAFTIRDRRNLAAGVNNDLTPSSKAATCNKFDAT